MYLPNTVAITHDTASEHGENDWTVRPSGVLAPLKIAGITDGRSVEGCDSGLHVVGIDRVVVVAVVESCHLLILECF
jgi:hypothetical protein